MSDWVMSVAAQACGIYERLRDYYGYSEASASAEADAFVAACYEMRRQRRRGEASKVNEILDGLPADLRAIVKEGIHP